MQHHVIRTETVEVNAPNDPLARRAMESLGAVQEELVHPMLDELFSSLVGEDEVLRLDRLVVDVGTFAPDTLASTLAERLEQELRVVLPPLIDEARAGRPTEGEGALPRAGAIGAIAEFLDTGRVPWYASAPVREDPARAFVELAASTARAAADLVRAAGPKAIERLVAQFPPVAYRSAVEVVVRADPEPFVDAVDGWLVLAARMAGPAPSRREIETRALQWLASRDRPDVSGLLDELAAADGRVHQELDQPLPPGASRDRDLPRVVSAWLAERGVAVGASSAAPSVDGAVERGAPVDTEPDQPAGEALPRGAREVRPQRAPTEISDAGRAEEAPEPGRPAEPGGEAEAPERVGIAEARAPAPKAPTAADRTDLGEEEARSIERSDRSTDRRSPPALDEAPAPPAVDVDEPPPAAVSPDLVARERVGIFASEPATADSWGDATYVDNAGLVLLWPFLAPLFRAVGLVEDGRFLDDAARERAVLLLHYVVTGSSECPEHRLVLNKLLCGWPLEETLAAELEPTDDERREVDELLTSVIDRWAALGSTSIEGLRTTFLQREGRLSLQAIGWTLLVPREAFDVLLDRLPWGVGVVALPWMDGPVIVEW